MTILERPQIPRLPTAQGAPMLSVLLKIGLGAATVFAALKALEQPAELSLATGLLACGAGIALIILTAITLQRRSR